MLSAYTGTFYKRAPGGGGQTVPFCTLFEDYSTILGLPGKTQRTSAERSCSDSGGARP
jgi:hypothetical protein